MKMQRLVMILTATIFVAGISSFADDNGDNGTKKVRKHKEQIQKNSDNANTDKKSKEDIQAARQKRIEARKNNQDASGDKPGTGVDKRQSNQEKRIQQGIKKGYLTDAEVATLTSQQQKIADLETSYKADGKLTADERKKLQQELNTASLNIWAEKHDTEGNQMPTYRFGKNVFAKDSITSQLSGDMTGADAKKIAGDFRQMMTIKKKLSSGDLSDEERTKLQSQYDTFLNTYFEVR